ncbi:MAG: DUF547 domain-containing protein [Pseudomonadales bacterium]
MNLPSTRQLMFAFAIAAVPAGVLAAPAAELWSFWERSDETSDEQVDHGAWQTLLDAYLVATGDNRTLFRYKAVSSGDRAALDAYVAGLTDVDPRSLARAEQLPYWINLYNALTVQVVLNHPDETSILDMGGGFFRPGPWNDDVARIAGQDVTLNDIEHRILRPIWNDQRIHFAVNCASIGCPNLAPRAYTRSNTPELLDAGQHDYLHHPRGLSLDDSGRLTLSSIFDWYVADFGGNTAALLGYLASQRPDLVDDLTNYAGRIRYEYDWSLNQAPAEGKD